MSIYSIRGIIIQRLYSINYFSLFIRGWNKTNGSNWWVLILLCLIITISLIKDEVDNYCKFFYYKSS